MARDERGYANPKQPGPAKQEAPKILGALRERSEAKSSIDPLKKIETKMGNRVCHGGKLHRIPSFSLRVPCRGQDH
ncbi:hypothetical protein BES34_008395 [Leptospira inadai serovar Lyme]|uniref:Uncharacterized protein n=1 Tax=Leptospira inadai serovar Lyme TaxID=293084 RepID=A0ABX4YJ47_9LEPT|nr:hypothetical protein BES34_008395 [Leptospira inadai serovar Lyme]